MPATPSKERVRLSRLRKDTIRLGLDPETVAPKQKSGRKLKGPPSAKCLQKRKERAKQRAARQRLEELQSAVQQQQQQPNMEFVRDLFSTPDAKARNASLRVLEHTMSENSKSSARDDLLAAASMEDARGRTEDARGRTIAEQARLEAEVVRQKMQGNERRRLETLQAAIANVKANTLGKKKRAVEHNEEEEEVENSKPAAKPAPKRAKKASKTINFADKSKTELLKVSVDMIKGLDYHNMVALLVECSEKGLLADVGNARKRKKLSFEVLKAFADRVNKDSVSVTCTI